VLLNYHICRFVLVSLCVGDLVRLGLSGVRVAGAAATNLQHTTNREQNDRCGNSTAQSQVSDDGYINLLTPNVNYSGRTAPLTSKVALYIFIQQIQVLNILNMVYTVRLFLFKMQFVS